MEVHGGIWMAESGGKYKTWELIRNLYNENIPMLFGGFYNEILNQMEKEGGAETTRREMSKFREVMDEFNLQDLGYSGSWYTWERGATSSTCARERLDSNGRASNSFKVDNAPILVDGTHGMRKPRRSKRGFKFETMWLLDEGCEKVVKEEWEKIVGSNSALGLGLSYSWRSIWSVVAFVKEGVIWRVGDGRSVDIWNDPWVGDEEGRFITIQVIKKRM
ncbi:hypothetical protein RDABS01_036352 [Bienertia sinuspersici]